MSNELLFLYFRKIGERYSLYIGSIVVWRYQTFQGRFPYKYCVVKGGRTASKSYTWECLVPVDHNRILYIPEDKRWISEFFLLIFGVS